MAKLDYEPVNPREAFEVMADPDSETTQDVAASQAALLLGARAGVLGIDEADMDVLRAEEEGDFTMPDLRPLKRERRMKVADATQGLGLSLAEMTQEAATPEHFQSNLAGAARDLYDHPSTEAAAALFEGAMNSPHPLVRVAAAAGARETTRLRRKIRSILEAEADCEDRLTARVAQTALAHIDRHHPAVEKYVIESPKSRKRRRKSRTSAVTHGTFASDSSWYQPGGDYYEALDANRPDYEVHDESFTWSGAYSHNARRADAALLAQWIDDQGLDEPDFFAHSHGGTVAQLATRAGARFDRLVLMGMPVHGEWFPDFSRVNRIIDVRVRFDLVIMADRGGQRYRTDQIDIEEHRNGWFDHTSTHESGYWDKHDLWQRALDDPA